MRVDLLFQRLPEMVDGLMRGKIFGRVVVLRSQEGT